MTENFRVFYRLQIAHSALFRAADLRTRNELDLTVTQLAVLFVLLQKDGQPISEISNTLAMGKSSLTGLIDRMCEKGLVRRAASAADGRVINIHLEDAGRQAVHHSKHNTDQFNQALLAPFTHEERRTIERFLTHVTLNADGIINGKPMNQDITNDDE